MNLYAASGSTILVCIQKTLTLRPQASAHISVDFLCRCVSSHSWCRFLGNFNLLVDMGNYKLHNTISTRSTDVQLLHGSSFCTNNANNPFASLPKSFPSTSQAYSVTIHIEHCCLLHRDNRATYTCPILAVYLQKGIALVGEEFASIPRLGYQMPNLQVIRTTCRFKEEWRTE